MPFISVYYLYIQLVLLSNQKKETFLRTISCNKYVIVICPPAWFPVTFPFSCNVFQFVRFLSASRPFSCKINCIIVIQWPRGIAPGKVVTEDGSSRVTSWLWQCVCAQSLSCVQFLVTPWTVATRLLCPWDSPVKSTGMGPSSRGFSQSRHQTQVSHNASRFFSI